MREGARSERQCGEFEIKAWSVLFDALTFLKKRFLVASLTSDVATVVAEQKLPQPENGFFFLKGNSLSFSVSVVLIQVNCL